MRPHLYKPGLLLEGRPVVLLPSCPVVRHLAAILLDLGGKVRSENSSERPLPLPFGSPPTSSRHHSVTHLWHSIVASPLPSSQLAAASRQSDLPSPFLLLFIRSTCTSVNTLPKALLKPYLAAHRLAFFFLFLLFGELSFVATSLLCKGTLAAATASRSSCACGTTGATGLSEWPDRKAAGTGLTGVLPAIPAGITGAVTPLNLACQLSDSHFRLQREAHCTATMSPTAQGGSYCLLHAKSKTSSPRSLDSYPRHGTTVAILKALEPLLA